MLTPEQVKQWSSTRVAAEKTTDRLQYLIDEAKLRIELFAARPFVEGDSRLAMIHFRLVESMALTDNDESLGLDARGIVSEGDLGYSYTINREAVTTGFPLIDSLLRQWMTYVDQQTDGGTTQAMSS
ncbi:hypothetical protein LOK74_05895 [Brevibacillus humidisoli]|uniref:hypothetical protein n=1 Tax=Brevibacillus humidisoli TaxID=2895522 RepID=UPI001E50EE3A|nr:hypothetical protein [Brevibacillus humidisoli]UFJ42030.1 hypothetical protein LOK74_05895 [Brevibacillus humidisoli]